MSTSSTASAVHELDDNGTPLADDPLAVAEARLRAVDASVRDFVVEHPIATLGIALAGGFLIGRLLSR